MNFKRIALATTAKLPLIFVVRIWKKIKKEKRKTEARAESGSQNKHDAKILRRIITIMKSRLDQSAPGETRRISDSRAEE